MQRRILSMAAALALAASGAIATASAANASDMSSCGNVGLHTTANMTAQPKQHITWRTSAFHPGAQHTFYIRHAYYKDHRDSSWAARYRQEQAYANPWKSDGIFGPSGPE